MRMSDWSSDVCSSDRPLDLAGGALDGRPVRLALGVLADPSAGGHRRLADRMGPAERPDSDRPLPAGELARPGFRRAGTCSDYRRLGSGRAAGLVQLTPRRRLAGRSEEHTSELQSLMRISYAVFCLKKKKNNQTKRDKAVIQKHE